MKTASPHPITRMGFLLREGFCLVNLAATLDRLKEANREAGSTRYEWRLLSDDGSSVCADAGVCLAPLQALRHCQGIDRLVVCTSPCSDVPLRPEAFAHLGCTVESLNPPHAQQWPQQDYHRPQDIPMPTDAPGQPELIFPRALETSIQLMQANIEEPLLLSEIARYVDLSRRQLERLFVRYLHDSPARFYLKIRVGHARDIIRQSQLPITEVAMMCGFEYSSCFSRCYRTTFGVSPSKDRGQNKAQDTPSLALAAG